MKIRNGLVSNSSSSSFIIALPKGIGTVEYLHEVLFGDNDVIMYFDEAVDSKKCSERVFSDISNKTVATDLEMINSLEHGWFNGYKDLPGCVDFDIEGVEFNSEEWRANWKELEKENVRRAKAIVKQFKKDNPDTDMYVLTYSDNNGNFESKMEHAGVFDNIPHIQTSYH